MATNSDNALITYGEVCKLGHFLQFGGTYNTSSYYNVWKKGSNKTGTYAIIVIYPVNNLDKPSTPMVFYGRSNSEKRRVYVSISGRFYVECDVTITFNWTLPFEEDKAQFILESITRVDNSDESINVTGYSHLGWMYIIEEG